MITIKALAANRAEILIHEAIGADYFGDGLTSKRFAKDLGALGDVSEILVRINSPGGAVFDGIAIYNALKSHSARIDVLVEGLAASVASVIAMSGDTISMAEGAQIMIHNPWTVAMGDAADMRKVAETLDGVAASMSEIYVARTGIDRNELASLLDAETWLDGPTAVAKGFADEHQTSTGTEAAAATQAHQASFRDFAARCREQLAALSPLQIAAAIRNLEESDVLKPAASATPQAASAADILARETSRRQQIRDRFHGFANEHRGLLDACLDDTNITPEAAGTRLLNALGSQAVPLGSYSVPTGSDFRAAAADALCLRAGVAIQNPHAASRDLHNTSVLEIARICVSQTGRSHRGLNPSQLIKAALTTSDFPGILENALGKALRVGYESDPQSHAAWVKKTTVPDFKTQSRLLLGSAPALLPVVERGEYKYGSLSENKATLAISKFGRLISVSWEMLINDDLGAFMTVPGAMGAAARRKEADDVYALFNANSGNGQTMQDTVALFHADHGNLSTTVGVLSTTTLGAARTLLRKQQALGNGGYLNLNPAFLIVPAEQETLAEEIMTKATRHTRDTVATNGRKSEATTPEWISRLTLVVEPRLTDTYGFYVAASHSQIDTCELATLAADGGAPVLDEEDGFHNDTKEYKVRHTFVAKFIDWKGIVRVPKT